MTIDDAQTIARDILHRCAEIPDVQEQDFWRWIRDLDDNPPDDLLADSAHAAAMLHNARAWHWVMADKGYKHRTLEIYDLVYDIVREFPLSH